MAEVQNINDQKQTTQQTPDWSLEWHDPRTLLTDKNIREIQPDPEMIRSVANVGVLQPIIGVRAVGGQVRVRYGEGRTLAAIAAERDLVPVIVTGPEGDSNAEEIARIIRQRAENTYRQGMTDSEHANSAYQLSLYGMAEKDIAAELQIPRTEVRAAKKLGKSQTGTAMLDDNDGLDLITAAKIAEFEDNPTRVARLLHYVNRGWHDDIDGVIRAYKAEDELAAERAKVQAELEAQGIRVTDESVGYSRHDSVRYVTELRDETGESLTAEQHADCPGHAMVIEDVEYFVKADGTLTTDVYALPEGEQADALPSEERLEGVAVCDQANELHPGPQRPEQAPEELAADEDREAREAQRKEAQKADRRRVIAGNREWDAAEPIRRDWVQKLLQRKTPPEGAMEFLTGEMLLAQYAVADGFRDGHVLAADWLGVEPGNEDQPAWQTMPAPRRLALQKLAEGVTDKRRMVLLLALVLAGNEKALNRHSWRQEDPSEGCAQRGYLRFIIDQGYPACSVERLAAGLPQEPVEPATEVDAEDPVEDVDAS
ncbi:ParB/RepB/Spo0J family partition protein [Kribbella sp. NPDC049174]|uniref:ParB/RepB/Spo0J family partition protein n=1 Tax=Kribbella sp. NPDC049174 TaxID=3364112 RepID=UPI00371C5EBC